MEIKDIFREKIESEYEDYLEMISGYETEEIAENSMYLANFYAVYTYLHDHEPLTDEQMQHLLKVERPIDLIANKYGPDDEEMHSTFMYICEGVTKHKIYASHCSDEVHELLSIMGEELDNPGKSERVAEEEKEVFEYLVNISSNISKHLAEGLMQFKNPLEVVRAATKDSPSLKDVMTETENYIENQDIFTLPHKLDYDMITDEAKWRHEAINEITSIIPRPDFKVTMSWIDFFRTLGDNAETFAENPYADYIGALHQISENQGDVILQQLYDMEKDTMILENELVEAAKYLADGGDYNKIAELAENGFFEGPYEEVKERFAEEQQQGGMDLC